MGVPSVFLRTFGCNFTCDSFGMPLGEKSNERNEVAARISRYKEYRDLPLVSTGCDSYASWDPRFKDFSPLLTTEAIVERIQELLPFRRWAREHLVITGGEPLLGWQRAYPDLLDHPFMQSLRELTFETNGTQPLAAEFKAYLTDWTGRRSKSDLTFSVSAKLPNSGERWEDAIRPDIVYDYQSLGWTYLKFVVATEKDVDHALAASIMYRDQGFTGEIYLMPVGGTLETYVLNTRNVAETCLKYGLRYSARLQCDLFKNAWGT